MSMKWLSLCFALQFLVAASIFVTRPHKNDTQTHINWREGLAANAPRAEMMTPGQSYLPKGAGCSKQKVLPEWTSPLNSVLAVGLGGTPEADYAIKYKEDGWNGFCQTGWTLCPDAAANKDYSYYWKGLGKGYARKNAYVDKVYCAENGWLKPEIRAAARNFRKLQQKGKQECERKWKKYGMKQKHLYDEFLSTKISMEDQVQGFNHTNTNEFWDIISFFRGEEVYGAAHVIMDEESAHEKAAWNCAMGDVSCDMFYCTAAYCEREDGSVGVMEECEGWDEAQKMIL